MRVLTIAAVTSFALLAWPATRAEATTLWRVDATLVINTGLPDAGEARQLVGTIGFDAATATVTSLDLELLGEPGPLVFGLDSIGRVRQTASALSLNLVAEPWSASATPPADPLGLGTLFLSFGPTLDPALGSASAGGSFGYCANVASSGIGCGGFPTRAVTLPGGPNTATVVPLPATAPLLLGAVVACAAHRRRPA